MIVWLNDGLNRTPSIDIADRGFTLGDGLFETLTVRANQIARLPRHLERLAMGCRVLEMAFPSADLEQVLHAVLKANGLTDAAIRVTLTRGPGPRGLPPPPDPRPTLLVTAGPLPPPAGPAAVIVATSTRRNEHSPLSRIKSLSYLDNVLARMEAARHGTDDALLLNSRERVVESASANLFVRLHGMVVTPPVDEGALPGTLRADILAAGAAIERPLTQDDLAQADEAALTNSLGVRPISRIGDRPLAMRDLARLLEASLRR